MVLVEQCARVEQLYIIFDDILLSLFSLADALLLATIFTYLIPLTPFARNNTVGRRAMSPPLMMHLGFCGLLSLFWIIIMCVSLAFSIQGVLSTGDYQLDTLNALWKLQLVYDILYLIAALEVLALSAAVLSSPKGHDRKVSQISKRSTLSVGSPGIKIFCRLRFCSYSSSPFPFSFANCGFSHSKLSTTSVISNDCLRDRSLSPATCFIISAPLPFTRVWYS